MDVLASALIALIVPIACTFVLIIMQKQSLTDAPKNRDAKAVRLRMPRMIGIVGWVCAIFFSVVLVFSVVVCWGHALMWAALIVFGGFVALGVFCINARRVYCVTLPIHADYLLYRTVWGRSYKVDCADCRGYRQKGSTLTLYTVAALPSGKKKKKTFYVDVLSVNFKELDRFLRAHGVECMNQ